MYKYYSSFLDQQMVHLLRIGGHNIEVPISSGGNNSGAHLQELLLSLEPARVRGQSDAIPLSNNLQPKESKKTQAN